MVFILVRNYSRVLVTGGAGFIGSHLVDRLIKDGLEVTVLDNLSFGQEKNLSFHVGGEDFRFVRGDIRDAGLVSSLVKDVDVIFHEAAIVSVPLTIEDPALAHDVNVNGTLNILMACLNSNVKRFVHASSCAVYGNTEVSPQNEGLPPSPISPYAATEVSAEGYCKAFHQVYGVETVSLRLFNVYGHRQKLGDYGGVLVKFIDRLSRNELPVIYGDGEQTRDFTYVEDVVEAHMLALNSKSAVGEVFNIATGYATKINKLLNMLADVMDVTPLRPMYAESRLGDVTHSCGDIAKARRVLGWMPRFSLEEGLRKLFEWNKRLA